MTARCRSCRAPIRWADVNGRAMPLDPEPTPDGNVVITLVHHEGSSLERAEARVLTAREQRLLHPDRTRYRSHFATCPNARRHRRPRTRSA